MFEVIVTPSVWMLRCGLFMLGLFWAT